MESAFTQLIPAARMPPLPRAPRTRCRAASIAATLGLTVLAAFDGLRAQDAPADLLLVNGKIITVDERFAIAAAVAIRGGRIVAVGTDAAIATFAGPATRTVDLAGKSVIPGLIDNHMHLLRAGATWEVRLDGVDSRSRALELLRAKAAATPRGQWIATLGGFTVDQFADDDRPLTRAELDAAVPDHPVLLQASYHRGYLNTRGLRAFGLDADGGQPAWLVRGADGRPTGELEEAGVRELSARLPAPSAAQAEAGTAAMIGDLNAAGLTAVGSAGCPGDLLALYRRAAEQEQLGVRVFCISGFGASTPAQAAEILPHIGALELFRGDEWVDAIAYGEGVYGPLHDRMFVARTSLPDADLVEWRRIAAEIARAGLPLHVHANFRATLSAFLDQIELVHRDTPVRNLRWVFAHANQLTPAHLRRMKALGMYAAVHPWAVINGGINERAFGEAAYDMPPLRAIQDSGITWGFGSDGSRANQILPFTTLWWAVTGKMVGGRQVLRQPISREAALIAHTRKNAYLIFQEDRLGAIQTGKLADLVVLDRDYLTIPADEIKDIVPVMTIVGGRIVHEAAPRQRRARSSSGSGVSVSPRSSTDQSSAFDTESIAVEGAGIASASRLRASSAHATAASANAAPQ